MTAAVGCGFLLAILLGVVIAVLRNVNFMHLHNFAGADERFREGWRGFLKKLLLVFGATVCLSLVFSVHSGRLYVAVAEIIMRLTGMDALDRMALAQENSGILFATMDISCGFAGASVPSLFTLAEMFLIYLVYQVVCLLFVSKVNEPALI